MKKIKQFFIDLHSLSKEPCGDIAIFIFYVVILLLIGFIGCLIKLILL